MGRGYSLSSDKCARSFQRVVPDPTNAKPCHSFTQEKLTLVQYTELDWVGLGGKQDLHGIEAQGGGWG